MEGLSVDGVVRHRSADAVQNMDETAVLDLDPDAEIGIRIDRMPVRPESGLPLHHDGVLLSVAPGRPGEREHPTVGAVLRHGDHVLSTTAR
ncbi:hypothetical protein GCM10009663_43420 [Kitasatospora arboriphila]|uniref:PDZ domain-containing protein n=1 Tax=Kitasatospora arboriphila TaxID=258052 RepID=A0ABP4E6T7_9ACTN